MRFTFKKCLSFGSNRMFRYDFNRRMSLDISNQSHNRCMVWLFEVWGVWLFEVWGFCLFV